MGRQRRGRPSIQGFATDISVDQGETVHFKVDTAVGDYRLDIYRIGYYAARCAQGGDASIPWHLAPGPAGRV